MSYREPARRATRRTRSVVLAAFVAVAATVAGVFIYQSLASSSPPPAPATAAPVGAVPGGPPGVPQGGGGGLGAAGGAVPDGVTVFDDEFPAIAELDPDLLEALRDAATDADGDGVEFHVNSGWRSPEYQEQLLDEAVAEYGSAEEAARWVSTPETSAHVSGDAVDIGGSDATSWLSEHGAGYGLCQIYRNEPWHYELRTDAVDGRCPRMFDDPTQDPRMQH